MITLDHKYYIYIFFLFTDLVQMYKWLTAYILKVTYEKVNKLKQEGKSNWQAKNDSQSYNAVMLSVIYGEVFFYIYLHFFRKM